VSAEELVDRGYEVAVAHDGREGLAAILRIMPDLVLSDISMPAMSGFELLERLIALAPRFSKMPFVFLTALTDILGSSDRAIQEAGYLLRISGRVLPVTLTDTTLCARLSDGHIIEGETDIDIRKDHHGVPISGIYLQPEAASHPPVLQATEHNSPASGQTSRHLDGAGLLYVQ